MCVSVCVCECECVCVRVVLCVVCACCVCACVHVCVLCVCVCACVSVCVTSLSYFGSLFRSQIKMQRALSNALPNSVAIAHLEKSAFKTYNRE